MTIMTFTSLRNQYNEISEKCKTTGEPIYLTKHGVGDLVVIYDIIDTRKDNILTKIFCE